jgi:hypothetical protein
MSIGAIIAIIVVVLIVAVVVYAARREHARRDYLNKKLNLRQISAEDQDFYATSWDHVQGGFLDNPALALAGAEQLVARLLAARGYPAADDDDHVALLSVQHGRVLADYQQARSVSGRAATDPTSVSTEEERTALMQYRALFEDLLAVPGATASRAS